MLFFISLIIISTVFKYVLPSPSHVHVGVHDRHRDRVCVGVVVVIVVIVVISVVIVVILTVNSRNNSMYSQNTGTKHTNLISSLILKFSPKLIPIQQNKFSPKLLF